MTTPQRATSAFAAVTALFFGWGFITSLVDPLIAAVKNIFSLSNTEAQLSAFAFFIAYGLVSLPAALLVRRLRAVRGIIVALALMAAGCLGILAASDAAAYPGVLAGLFVIASGITILQVAANPLTAALGKPEHIHLRLTLSQAFNSLGTVIGPLLGASLFLHGLDIAPGEKLDGAARGHALASINAAFLMITALIALLALLIWAMRGRIMAAAGPAAPALSVGQTFREAVSSRWALLGGAAIFLYVGAEVSIGSQMALFLHDPHIWGVPLQHAGYFVSLYWLGTMIGRFVGSALMVRLPAARLLAVVTAAAMLLCLVVFIAGGTIAGYAALAVGLANSIMFPTIFSLTLERSSASEEVTAGFLCTTIVGGAFLPLLVGGIADAAGYQHSFIVPALCYACLFGFALLARRARTHAISGSAAMIDA